MLDWYVLIDLFRWSSLLKTSIKNWFRLLKNWNLKDKSFVWSWLLLVLNHSQLWLWLASAWICKLLHVSFLNRICYFPWLWSRVILQFGWSKGSICLLDWRKVSWHGSVTRVLHQWPGMIWICVLSLAPLFLLGYLNWGKVIYSFLGGQVEKRLKIIVEVRRMSSMLSKHTCDWNMLHSAQLFLHLCILTSRLLLWLNCSVFSLHDWLIGYMLLLITCRVWDQLHQHCRILLEKRNHIIPFVLMSLLSVTWKVCSFKGRSQLCFLFNDLNAAICLFNINETLSQCWALWEKERTRSIVSMNCRCVQVDLWLIWGALCCVLYLLKLSDLIVPVSLGLWEHLWLWNHLCGCFGHLVLIWENRIVA